MKIALVSDTHVPASLPRLPDRLLEKLAGADAILHAGDLVTLEVLEILGAIAPTTAVSGNMDPPEVNRRLNAQETLKLGGRTIGLQHGHQRRSLQSRYIGLSYDASEFDLFYQAMATQLPDAEIIGGGHFHVPVIKEWNDRLFINPGAVAASHRRSSFAILELGEKAIPRIIELDVRTKDPL